MDDAAPDVADAQTTAPACIDITMPDASIPCPPGNICVATGGATGHVFCTASGGPGLPIACGEISCAGGCQCSDPAGSVCRCTPGDATLPPPDLPA
jgi:hypothetical protein